MPPIPRRLSPKKPKQDASVDSRVLFMAVLFGLIWLVLLGRFFQLQVLEYQTYKLLASDQHEVQASLIPKRGTIYLRDRVDGSLHPIAQDRDAWQVYAVPKEMKTPANVAKELAPILALPEADLSLKLSVSTSSYTVLARDVSYDAVTQLREKAFEGIGISKGLARAYPEEGIGGQAIGFVNFNDKNERVGRYGIEGFQNDLLAGEPGMLLTEKDASGRRLAIGNLHLKEARDGSDVVLTIDRTIQYTACRTIQAAVKRFEAESGSVVILNPDTGAVMAMCGAPDFEPAHYGDIDDLGTLNNQVTIGQYEPGSIFKPITMAAGLDAGKVNPKTTYVDSGAETMDDFTIRNSDKKANGVQTMTQVLEKSLNTGAIFVERLLGNDVFRDYVHRFGFGEKTNIGLPAEAKGDVSSLDKKGKVFAATASFGQGITATPIQLVTAFAALGNGGRLMKPFLVDEIIHPDGTHEVTHPELVANVISPRASSLISAMMVSVVENGHGKLSGVPGYYVAGKTGTAQVPDPRGKGYLKDVTIGSFAGYAPSEHPKFVMLVRIDKPKTVQYAESSAAPVFGELAKFLLTYLEVPPERPIKEPKLPPLPEMKATSSTVPSGSATGTVR